MNRSLLVLTVLLGGCWVPMTQGKVMENDIRSLRDRVVYLEDRAEDSESRLRGQLAKAEEQSKRLKVALDEVEALARRAKAGFGEDLAQIRRESAQIIGRLEQLEQRVKGAADATVSDEVKAHAERLAKVVERLAALEAQAKAPPPQAPQKAVVRVKAGEAAADGKDKLPNDSRALFKKGRTLLSSGKHKEGREVLGQWLKRFGQSSNKGRRAAVDDVHVYIGESLLATGQPKLAVPHFQKVYEMKPARADMWSRAVFRLAECFEKIQDKVVAKAFYKIVASDGRGRYKKDAKRRLKRLQ